MHALACIRVRSVVVGRTMLGQDLPRRETVGAMKVRTAPTRATREKAEMASLEVCLASILLSSWGGRWALMANGRLEVMQDANGDFTGCGGQSQSEVFRRVILPDPALLASALAPIGPSSLPVATAGFRLSPHLLGWLHFCSLWRVTCSTLTSGFLASRCHNA